ncbi:MAG: hypothetical protein M3Q19_13070 [Pseudomonadota bacterium]|nr:hypothetical protein [Pseudomonadota bacterium]
MTNWTFDAPAGLQDFPDPAIWHDLMAAEADGIIRGLVYSIIGKNPSEEEIAQYRDEVGYADPTQTELPAAAETVAVQAWNAFPRAVKRQAPWNEFDPDPIDSDGSYRAVEHLGDEDHRPGIFVDSKQGILSLPVRDRQDEYLEWAVQRNPDGRITKVTFVAEGYDYFSALFDADEQKCVELYRELTGVGTITADDIRARYGVYRQYDEGGGEQVARPGGLNPRNQFNINPGIVHLSHRANSLGAEVNLAGVSALARKKGDGSTLDGANPEQLLCCNRGGEPNRNSDPLISAQAYAQILEHYRYTLANPVGLYIADIADGLLLPDNKTRVPRDWWTVIRGHDLWSGGSSRVLRLELEVPASENLTVSDLLVGGNPVIFAGQIAELLSVHLFITRWKRSNDSIGPIVRCLGTCCRRDGTQELFGVRKEASCRDGYSLAFPGLLPPEQGNAFAAIAKPAGTHAFKHSR